MKVKKSGLSHIMWLVVCVCVCLALQDALEIRTYLHDRNLMEYADALEASGKTLAELLHSNSNDLSTDYHMKRGHVARFLDRGSACAIQLPKDLTLPARKITAVHHGLETEEPAATHKQPKAANLESVQASIPEQEIAKPMVEPARSDLDMVYPGVKMVTSTDGGSTIIDHSGGSIFHFFIHNFFTTLSSCTGLVSSSFETIQVICNEEFTFFDTSRVWLFDGIFVLEIIWAVYHARTFIPR